MLKLGSLGRAITSVYEGEQTDNIYHGHGTIVFSSKNSYEGDFVHGLMNGNGTYTWKDGTLYTGAFSGNKINGVGNLKWMDGCEYEGEFKNNMRNGKGEITIPSGKKYEGQWKDGKVDGQGTIYYNLSLTEYYIGSFQNGLKHGKGRMVYASGNEYEGEWKSDAKHGTGIMRWKERNEVYSGTWENGLPNGVGEYIWFAHRTDISQYPGQNYYEGEFVDGKRHGFGTFYYASGAMYKGEWKNNMKDGFGYFISENGREYQGQWKRDNMLSEFPPYKNDTPYVFHDSHIFPKPPKSQSHSQSQTNSDTVTNALRSVNAAITRHIVTLRKLYRKYSFLTELFPKRVQHSKAMTREQFWYFLLDSKICKAGLTLAMIDRAISAPAEGNKHFYGRSLNPHNPNEIFIFHDFLTALIIISTLIYDPMDSNLSIHEVGVAATLNTLLKNYAKPLEELWHQNQITRYNDDVYWTIFREFHQSICKVYQVRAVRHRQSLNGAEKDMTITYREFLLMLQDYELMDECLSPVIVIDLFSKEFPKVVEDNCCNLDYELVVTEFFYLLYSCGLVQADIKRRMDRERNMKPQPVSVAPPPIDTIIIPTIEIEGTESRDNLANCSSLHSNSVQSSSSKQSNNLPQVSTKPFSPASPPSSANKKIPSETAALDAIGTPVLVTESNAKDNPIQQLTETTQSPAAMLTLEAAPNIIDDNMAEGTLTQAKINIVRNFLTRFLEMHEKKK